MTNAEIQNQVRTFMSLVRERWPYAVSRIDDTAPDTEGGPTCDVFGIPDGESGQFMTWLLSVDEDHAAAPFIDQMSVIPHTVSATRSHYPEMHHRYRVRRFMRLAFAERVEAVQIEAAPETPACAAAAEAPIPNDTTAISSLPKAA